MPQAYWADFDRTSGERILQEKRRDYDSIDVVCIRCLFGDYIRQAEMGILFNLADFVLLPSRLVGEPWFFAAGGGCR